MVAAVIVAVSSLVSDIGIVELEVNPLLVFEAGAGVCAQ